LDLLERVKKVTKEWILPGHQNGQNSHNVSATVSIKENEWEPVGNWMWQNRNYFNGLAVLPYDGGTYKQAPFEDCTEEQYNRMVKTLNNLDLTQVEEHSDETNLTGELACAGAEGCEIT